jgi:hypothetical protein
MTAAVVLPWETFCAPAPAGSEFVALARRCLAERGTLTLRLAAEEAAVALEPGVSARAPVRLEGRWRIAGLAPPPRQDTGARLLLPLLFRTAVLHLPHDQIYAPAREHRAPAGFFARNLALALLRGTGLDWAETAEDPDARRTLRAFQDQYVFALKALVPDGAFAARSPAEVADLVLAGCYLPVTDFANPVLARGSAALRRAQPDALADRQARLMAARAAVLEQIMP